MRGEPTDPIIYNGPGKISTHSPRAGRTHGFVFVRSYVDDFNSLAPCGANLRLLKSRRPRPHFNSLAPCGANRDYSIMGLTTLSNFNSLAPCGANRRRSPGRKRSGLFQLTRPVRGEPDDGANKHEGMTISTHSPRAGRTWALFSLSPKRKISTHSPRAGRTCLLFYPKKWECAFQLTRPVRGEPSITG